MEKKDSREGADREVAADGEAGGGRGLVADGGEVAGEPVERLGLVVAEADGEALEQVDRPGRHALARLRRRHHHRPLLQGVLRRGHRFSHGDWWLLVATDGVGW